MSTGLPPIAPALERRWILTLSGGGYRGLFTAQVLARLESELERPLHTVFDLVAGTSIGSILALGIAHGIPAAELVEFFKRDGAAIFPSLSLWDRARMWAHPKYSSVALSRALDNAFRSASFATLKTRVLVPAVDLTDSGPVLFRTKHGSLAASAESLADAALASSAAPTYFQPHPIKDQLYVDGGLIANSPDALALTESIAVLGWPLHSLHLLSIGTTAAPSGLPNDPKAHWGVARWGWKLQLLEQMMAAQAKLSRDSARLTLGSRFCLIDALRGDAQNRVLGLDRASDAATKTLLGMADAAWSHVRSDEAALLQALKLHSR